MLKVTMTSTLKKNLKRDHSMLLIWKRGREAEEDEEEEEGGEE